MGARSGKSSQAPETPLMEQYRRIKANYRDAVLFFRMGDFYEMFYEDAEEAARLLGLTLTSRNSGKAKNVPLAGIPVKAVNEYLVKLVRAGRKVAICEQVQDPKEAKGIVEREVVEVVTPGTALAESLLEASRNNYLAALCRQEDRYGLAYADLSTGEFALMEIPAEKIGDELSRLEPTEYLLPSSWETEVTGQEPTSSSRVRLHTGLRLGGPVTFREDWRFAEAEATERLLRHFGVQTLDGFGCQGLPLGVAAAGALLAYLEEVQPRSLGQITRLRTHRTDEGMVLDEMTLRNLEILAPLRPQAGAVLRDGTGKVREPTLLALLDDTQTRMGARALRRWLVRPLADSGAIARRLDAVEALFGDGEGRLAIRGLLGAMGDVERLTGRIAASRASPRELAGLGAALERVPAIRERLQSFTVPLLEEIQEALDGFPALREEIQRALVDDPPATLAEGGVIREGYDQELDSLRDQARGGKDWIARLQETERKRTGIQSLKVGFNKVFGYYIEVTKPNLHLVPEEYIRKQTISTGERFVTPELKDQEEQVLTAEERAVAREEELFRALRDRAAAETAGLQELANRLAALDVLSMYAEVAAQRDFVRPVVDDGQRLEITGGRHPVVEAMLPTGEFVPNNIILDPTETQIMILTGPNMAGKSTLLRQVGLIVLMAQAGSFVPAEAARIGAVDRIFTRVGASDSLAGGQSTFLVEMAEAANILNNASARSLVLLDEVGRGTATFDGLALAWAIVEHLHNAPDLRAKTVFATHYHELTRLEAELEMVRNFNVQVKELGDGVIFLHKIAPGGTDRSYGIQVARIAGLPPEVLARARQLLHQLEAGDSRFPKRGQTMDQLPLFGPVSSPILEDLQSLRPEEMTPKEALDYLFNLKERLES